MAMNENHETTDPVDAVELDPNDPPIVDEPIDPTAALLADVPEKTHPIDVSHRKVVLEMKDIGKSFPGVKALQGVSLTVREGEVHALLGENGAGKSTLIKILSGAYSRDEGEIFFDGVKVEVRNPTDAEKLGISTIYQEFNLGKSLTIAENIFLGHLPTKGGMVDWATVNQRSREILDSLGVKLSVSQLAGELSVAQQQMVEIAKALNRETRILIMDEPSAVLSEKDLDHLFEVVRKLQARGIGIIYISHRLKEIFELADEVTILKDGRYVATKAVGDVTMDDLVKLMVGRDLTNVYPHRTPKLGEVVIEVKNLGQRHLAKDVSFAVRAGEIVGLAGITGSGRTEVARVIFGADPPTHGEMFLHGKPFKPRSPRDAIDAGIALVTEDRKAQGLLLKLQTYFNVTISGLKRLRKGIMLDLAGERKLVDAWIKNLRIKTPNQEFLVVNMSGGNQQKVVLARWLSLGIKVFIMDEPTRGIDVGSKSEIYHVMGELAEQGMAIIMISSELPEILGMSDRVLVMREGRIVKELDRSEASEETVMHYAVASDEPAPV